ncbi:MAG: hypothetical protein JXA10_14340 [Anaerolineae bacterium]|nr:hypothetical protein [Anaerolineae bacterium]
MRFLRQLIALSIVLVFMFVLPCSLWTFHLQRILLAGDTYETAFDDAGFYQDLTPRVLPALLKGLHEEHNTDDAPYQVTLLETINHLDERDWNHIAPELVPATWVEYTVETNLNAWVSWINGDAPTLEIIFRTETLRRRLESNAGIDALAQIAEALPPCDPAQTEQFDAYLNGEPDGEFPYCRPESREQQDALLDLLDQARLDAVAQFPQDLDVIEEMRTVAAQEMEDQGHPDEKTFTDADLNQARSVVRLWKHLLPAVLLIPIALLALIVIFAVRSFKTFFRWMGWALMLGCVLTLAPLFMLPFMVGEAHFETELETGFAAGGALIAEVLSNRMFDILVGQFTWPILIQAAILLVVGFIFAVLSVLLNDPDAPPDVVNTPTGMQVYQTPSGELVYVSTTGSTPTGTPIVGHMMPDQTPPPEQNPPV